MSLGWDAKREREIKVPRIVWDPEPVDIAADEAIAPIGGAQGVDRSDRLGPSRGWINQRTASRPRRRCPSHGSPGAAVAMATTGLERLSEKGG